MTTLGAGSKLNPRGEKLENLGHTPACFCSESIPKSKIRSRVEHVFAEQKDRMGLFIRTIGIARATTKVGMANLVYNIKRFIFLRKIVIA
jgi:hypothetical protein